LKKPKFLGPKKKIGAKRITSQNAQWVRKYSLKKMGPKMGFSPLGKRKAKESQKNEGREKGRQGGNIVKP